MPNHVPTHVQDDMLFAVDSFDESHAVTPNGNPRDYIVDTKIFWQSLAVWAPVALVGEFDMTINTTGELTIHFRPKK